MDPVETAELVGKLDDGEGRESLGLYRELFMATTSESVLAAGVNLAQAVMGVEMAWCGAALNGEGDLVMMAHVGLEREEMIHSWRVPVGSGIGGRVAQSGQFTQTRDYRRDPRRIPGLKSVIDREGARGALIGPLLGPALPPAALYVAQRSPRTFSATEISIFEQLCRDVANTWSRALERQQLVQRLLEQADLAHDNGKLLDGELACFEALNTRDDLVEALHIAASHLAVGLELVYRPPGPVLVAGPTTLALQAEIPIHGTRGILAHMLIHSEVPLSDRQRGSLFRIAQAVSLAVDRHSVAEEVARRLKGELIDDIVSEVITYGDISEDVRTRCALLNLNCYEPHTFVAISDRSKDASSFSGTANRSIAVLDEVLSQMFPRVHLFPRSGRAIALISSPRTSSDEFRRGLSSALQHAEGRLGKDVVAGVGSLARVPSEYPASMEEASLALEAAVRRGGDRICGLADIDLYGILGQLGSSRIVGRAVRAYLAPLIGFDGDERGELVSTLNAYFQAWGSANRAATSLAVHPNTVRYRVRKAGELLGADLEDADRRFFIELAVRMFQSGALMDGGPEVK